MTKLPSNPTKQQEIEHLRAFVNSLPQYSYLALIFKGDNLKQRLEEAIKNDYTTIEP